MDPILNNHPDDEMLMLPDEVLAAQEAEKLRVIERLEAFGRALQSKRTAAINGRKNSGVETEWDEDEDQYQGIDNVSDGGTEWNKPSSPDGVLTSARAAKDGRSTVFLNITRPYVDAAAAKVADILLPTDDRNWGIKPTPMPELSEIVEARLEDQLRQASQPQQPQGMPGMPPQQAMPPVPMDKADEAWKLAQSILDDADKRSDKAQTKIEDWLVECQYHAEVRLNIEDAAKLGTGVLKGPMPVKRKRRSFDVIDGVSQLVIEEAISPASKRVDVRNFFPDPACGENIHAGNYIWERDFITARELKKLVGLPGYIESQIVKVLEEGPARTTTSSTTSRARGQVAVNDDDRFEIWYFTGVADKEDLEAAGVTVPEGQQPTIPALVTMVNDSVIKGAISPLESGEFPYDVFPWQRRAGHWAGIGVSRQIRTAQRMLNAATRGMMDNAALSSGPQIVLRRGVIEPVDGRWTITPRKLWFAKNDADIQSVEHAFKIFTIDSRQAELMNIIQFSMKLAEDSTGLPMILQGQQGQAPDTVGGMQLLQNNASSVLRRLARTFDDCVTEPHIRRYYEWLMLDPDVPEDYKGDYVIDARGSTALVERDIANQNILQMGAMAQPGNPFGIDPKKWFAEASRTAWKLDPKRFQYTEAEQAKMAAAPPPEPPQITAAKINADSRLKAAGMQQEGLMARVKADTDRDTVYVQSEMARDQVTAEAKREELLIKRELAMLDYANKRGITLEQIKADLAKETMRLKTQKELALASHTMDLHNRSTPQVATPAVEPPGRAAPGEAFQG